MMNFNVLKLKTEPFDKVVHLEKVCEALVNILSDEYMLFQQTLNFHWNIEGANFIATHEMLESQYEWLKENVDSIAERIRTLGYTAPARYKTYMKTSSVTEGSEQADNRTMIATLCESHSEVINQLRDTIKSIKDYYDFATEDLLIKLLGEHEKALWMLRSHLTQR
jgi:starvation-inducible DNA-binding protein